MECLLCSLLMKSKANSKKAIKQFFWPRAWGVWGAVEHFPKVLETLKQVASVCDGLQALCKQGQLAGPYTSSNSPPKPSPPQVCMGSKTRSGNESKDFRGAQPKRIGGHVPREQAKA